MRLAIVGGESMNGFVFCSHEEIVHDVMNDDRPYLLFQPSPHHTELINKHTIARVGVLDNHSREMEVYSRVTTHGSVSILFSDGTEAAGHVCPRHNERVSDIINKDGNFFLFVPDTGSMNYVSSSHVDRVVMHDNLDDPTDGPVIASAERSKIILPGAH